MEKCPQDVEDAEGVNYADPLHRILSDALNYVTYNTLMISTVGD